MKRFGFEQLLSDEMLHDLDGNVGGQTLHPSQRVPRVAHPATHVLYQHLRTPRTWRVMCCEYQFAPLNSLNIALEVSPGSAASRCAGSAAPRRQVPVRPAPAARTAVAPPPLVRENEKVKLQKRKQATRKRKMAFYDLP